MSNCFLCYPQGQGIYTPAHWCWARSNSLSILLGEGPKRGCGGEGGGPRGRGSRLSKLSGLGRVEPGRGWSREAGRPQGLGGGQQGWQSGMFGQLCLPLPLTPHLSPPAGPPTLTSKIHPQASPSSLPIQANVSLTRASSIAPTLSLGALWLTAPSPRGRWTETALLSLVAWNEFWPPGPYTPGAHRPPDLS